MDRVGLLRLPVSPPTLGTNPETRTPAPGDPLLAVVASFCATVLQADCGAAWRAFERDFPDLPTTVPGPPGAPAATGMNVVRFVDFVDPKRGKPFDANDFPGLFVFRARGGTIERFTADTDRRSKSVVINWISMKDPSEVRGEHDTFSNAIASSLELAFKMGRHASWVVPADLAQPQALRANLATSTTAVTIAGAAFTGVMATTTLDPPRPIRITTSPSAATFETTKPITVVGTLDTGKPFTENIFLSDADGDEEVDTIFSFVGPVSVTLPQMLATGGIIDIGYADSPEARRGSMIQRYAQARIRMARPGELLPIVVQGPDGRPIRGYDAVELALAVQEHVTIDPAVHFDPWTGSDMTFVLPNGTALPIPL